MNKVNAPPGKRVLDDLYLHKDALDFLELPELLAGIRSAFETLPQSSDLQANVAKVNLRTHRISLLSYPTFEDEAFPSLAGSWTISASGISHFRSYASSLNPPILHRKELLVRPDHPRRKEWSDLTSLGESLGLFDDPLTIGFKLNWERTLRLKGFQLSGNSFVPLGNDVSEAPIAAQSTSSVQRHLTALSRTSLSAPVQLLLRHSLLTESGTFFDYGCGRGGDVEALRSEGLTAHGWDPHYAPENELCECDVVNLGFVVNVIEDPAERVDAIHKAFSLARTVLAVSVMLYSGDSAGRPYGDGVLTSRNTFQKYFSQSEFKDYLEHVLHRPAYLVGPGIAFIFSDQEAEQRFNAGLYRSGDLAARLLTTRYSVPRPVRVPKERTIKAPRPSAKEVALSTCGPFLDAYWARALDLGRWPDMEEIDALGEWPALIRSSANAKSLVSELYDLRLLESAAAIRADDLRVFFAAQQFSKRQPYKHLEPRLQRDIKSFFGDYGSALRESLRLLVDTADTAKILAACQQAEASGLGHLNAEHSLQLHISLVERLPAILRAYVNCGLVLWNSISEVDLVKIHIGSGKLTLLEFDDFAASPIPKLKRRIKVNLRRLDYDLFEYGSDAYPMPTLYFKSRYMNEDVPGYPEQLAFDEALEASGVIPPDSPEPSEHALQAALELKRLCIRDRRLLRSDRIPDLDQSCGANFTFRSFVECGETQIRTNLPNIPLHPDTYNSLFDLAVNILDPVIDYFGGIRLTYGFSSAALVKRIDGRIAPALDQHACCEVNKKGLAICDRLGAACDFIVDDEDMAEVAEWVIKHTPFDRLYFYGAQRPIHVSFGPQNSRAAYRMMPTRQGHLVPKPW